MNPEDKEENKPEVEEVLPPLETKIITVNGRPVKIHEFKIDWEEKKELVQIKKLAYGERSALTETFMKVEILGKNKQRTKYSYHDMVMNSMLTGIVKAPFPITKDYIYYELEPKVGKIIYKNIDRLNKLNEEDKKN